MRSLIDVPFGTRFIGHWEQEPVKSEREVIEKVEEYLGIDNIGISVCTYEKGRPYLLFLPFDFDSDILRDAWRDAKELYNHMMKSGYGVYISYSGKKGFHVYVITKPKTYGRRQIRVIQNMFKNMLNLKTLDEQIFGDIRRLMRIPQTININGGVCRILSMSSGKELDLDVVYKDTEDIVQVGEHTDSEFHDYPCIESIVRDDIEPRHLIRFTYVALRISEGWSNDEILDEIESFGWVDFKEDYTAKQIEHIRGRGYIPPSCKTLKELGYCTVEDCIYDDTKVILDSVGI